MLPIGSATVMCAGCNRCVVTDDESCAGSQQHDAGRGLVGGVRVRFGQLVGLGIIACLRLIPASPKRDKLNGWVLQCRLSN